MRQPSKVIPQVCIDKLEVARKELARIAERTDIPSTEPEAV